MALQVITMSKCISMEVTAFVAQQTADEMPFDLIQSSDLNLSLKISAHSEL